MLDKRKNSVKCICAKTNYTTKKTINCIKKYYQKISYRKLKMALKRTVCGTLLMV